MSPPWFVQGNSAGKSFFDGLHARPSFFPTVNGFASEQGASIASAHQLNGFLKPPAIGVSTQPTNPRFWHPMTVNSAASTAGDATIATRILLSSPDAVADAQTQYSNWSSTVVGAALVIIRIPTDDGNFTAPLLACVHCPTVLRRGHTVDRPWDSATLLPDGGPTPAAVVFPMAATIHHDTRKLKASFDPLEHGTILSLPGDTPFKPIVSLSTVASVKRAEMNHNAGNPPTFSALWSPKLDALATLGHVVHTQTQSFQAAADADMTVLLPCMLPLSSPCIIPPGVIGALSGISTVEKLREVLSFFLHSRDRSSLDTLDYCPLLHEWIHAAHAEPLVFLTDWLAFADIKDSFALSNPYTVWQEDYLPAPFREQQFAFLMQQLLRKLAWHIHLDWARSGPASDPNNLNTKRFERWLTLAYTPAFSLAQTPLGHAPIEHTGELPYLRPLATKSIRETFGLDKFMALDLYLPLLATYYVPFPVNPFVTKDFKNVELFTQADADGVGPIDSDESSDDDDLVLTPAMKAYQSSVQRRQRPITIDTSSTPQRKRPPVVASPASTATPTGQQNPPGYGLPPGGPPVMFPPGVGPPPNTTTVLLPPFVPPGPPPPFYQPSFHTGRTNLPMSPTRLSRASLPPVHTWNPPANRPPYSSSSARVGAATAIASHHNPYVGGRWHPGIGPAAPGFAHGRQHTPSPRDPFATVASSLPRPRQERRSLSFPEAELPPLLGRPAAIHHASQPPPAHDPTQWSLTAPDPRQPPGHWFFSALMAYTWDGFRGYYATSIIPVGPICTAFVPSLWPTFQQHCLVPSRAADGRKWQAGISRERAQSHSEFRPHQPLIEQIPDEQFDAYRTGQWQLMETILSPTQALQSFSAYSLLTMLPRPTHAAAVSKECRFPLEGVSYRDALLLLINLIWMLGMTVIWPSQEVGEQDYRQGNTIILVALNRLHSALCEVGSQGQSLETLWNSSVDIRHRLSFRMLADIDNIFGCFIRVILPFERPQIFFQVDPHPNAPAALAQHTILWPMYSGGHEPRMLSPSNEPPNLLQAIHTYSMAFRSDWQSYFTMQATQLHLPPLEFLHQAPARLQPAPHPGRDDREPPLKKPKASADQQGKKTPLQAASPPLLQFAPAVSPSNHSFDFVKVSIQGLKAQGHKPPKVANTKSTSFCFPFLLKGLGCSCNAHRTKTYAHVDLSTWQRDSLSELKTYLELEAVAAIFVMSEPLRQFLNP
jgi:hypothetical protein